MNPRNLAHFDGLCEINAMANVLKQVLAWMPFFFGIGFIAPLIAQLMVLWDIPAPFGISRIAFGLIIGGTWGLVANIRGRWL